MNKLQSVRIVLCRTSHPGNIGSAARAMKTMGLSHLVLVRPRAFPHEDTWTMASGATDVLENIRVCATLQEALAGCALTLGLTARRRELSHPVLSPREAAAEVVQTPASETVALVFGNETNGLTNEELMLCHKVVHIPANPAYSSLNLAAAVQLLAYELRLAAVEEAPGTSRRREPATHDEIEGFYQHLEAAMTASGFLDQAQPKRLMLRLRRLYARAGLQKEEVNILRGMLNAFMKKP